MKKVIPFVIIATQLLLSACGSETTPAVPEPKTESTTAHTQPAAPTNTIQPTPTMEPIIFLDTFDGGLKDGWSWINEDPERWSITDEGWLTISAANPGMGASETSIGIVNLLSYPAPEGDFVVTTRVIAEPDENFKQATLYLLGDQSNYVAILNGFCSFCLPDGGGYGIFMEAMKDKENLLEQPFIARNPVATDHYLRLVYSADNNSVTGFHSTSAGSWQEAFTIENAPAFDKIALGTGNLPGPDGSSYDLQSFFDYLEISRIETEAIVNPHIPQPTPLPTATPLSEGILFRDDFDSYFQPGWEWYNEDPENWEFVDLGGTGWLQLTGGEGRTNFLLRDAPSGNYVVTAHIIADPNENFQQANIGVYEDFENYIVINIGFCSMCVEGGDGFYMETFINNNPFQDAYKVPRDPEVTDVYFKLEVEEGASITSYYATPDNPDEWIKIGAFGHYFDFVSVGLGASNILGEGQIESDIVALYEYFEISQP